MSLSVNQLLENLIFVSNEKIANLKVYEPEKKQQINDLERCVRIYSIVQKDMKPIKKN